MEALSVLAMRLLSLSISSRLPIALEAIALPNELNVRIKGRKTKLKQI